MAELIKNAYDADATQVTPVSIELSQSLGQRTIHDGLYIPPKPLVEDTEIE